MRSFFSIANSSTASFSAVSNNRTKRRRHYHYLAPRPVANLRSYPYTGPGVQPGKSVTAGLLDGHFSVATEREGDRSAGTDTDCNFVLASGAVDLENIHDIVVNTIIK